MSDLFSGVEQTLRNWLPCAMFRPFTMGKHEFEVPLTDIDAGGKHFVFPIRAAWIRGAFEGVDGAESRNDGKLDVRISKSGTDVVVHGSLEAEVQVPCARCLEPAHVKIQEPVSALMVPRGQLKEAAGEDDEATAEQPDVLPYDGDLVVLDDFVRDELMLEIPMIPLCSEDCPGISPTLARKQQAEAAKATDTLDPRLAPLLKFKNVNKE